MGRHWPIAAVILSPLAVWSFAGIDAMQFRNAVFIVLGLTGMLWLVPNPWIRAFLGWAVVSFAWNRATRWGLAGLLGLLAWAIFYREATHMTEATWRSLRQGMLAACAFQVLWMGVQAAGVDPLFHAVSWRGDVLAQQTPQIAGWFLNPMDAALFFGLAAPVLATLSAWWLLLVAVPTVLWLKATAGLAAIAIAAAWSLRPWWRFIVPALIVLTALYAWQLDPQGFGAKPTVWRSLGLAVLRTPIVGAGPNALGYSVRTFQPVPLRSGDDPRRHETMEWNFAFNEWLQGAVEFGLVGVALALGYLGSLLWRLRGRWTRVGECAPALLIVLALSVTSIPFRIGPVALLAALYLGRLEALLPPTLEVTTT